MRAALLLLLLWGNQAHRQGYANKFTSCLTGPDLSDTSATFLARHYLWWGTSLMHDEVVVNTDGTFFRKSAPEEFGKWAIRGCHFVINWSWWGHESLTLEDAGRYLSNWMFDLRIEQRPAWWIQAVSPCFDTHHKGSNRSSNIVWTHKDALPFSEGQPMKTWPSDENWAIEQIKEWCELLEECIGFSVTLHPETGAVESWEPKQSASGFDPETAVWQVRHHGDDDAVKDDDVKSQFHWKTDAYSLQSNDDRSNFLLLCPPGLFQCPEYGFMCCEREDGSGMHFNKDGTINLEYLVVQRVADTWAALQTPEGRMSQFPSDVEYARDFAIESVISAIIEPLKLSVMSLTWLAHAVGHGAGIGSILMGAAHVVHFAAHAWFAIPVSLLAAYLYNVYQWSWRIAAHEQVMTAPLYKSQCMQKTHIPSSTLQLTHLRSDLEEQCGSSLTKAVAFQIPRTLQSMKHMFGAMENLALCLGTNREDLGEAVKNATSCSELVMPVLKGRAGRPGLLYSAVSMAAIFGLQADELLKQEAKLGITEHFLSKSFRAHEDDFETIGATDTPSLDRLKTLDSEQKQLTCAGFLVSLRSYETIFFELSDAFQLWMQTYALDDTQNWWENSPCKTIFAPTQQGSSRSWQGTQGTCKLAFASRPNVAQGEEDECEKASNTCLYCEDHEVISSAQDGSVSSVQD